MSTSICCATFFAPLAQTLGVRSPSLCGCDACNRLPDDDVFVPGCVTVFRPSKMGCPECVATAKDNQDRLPVTGTGAAPQGAARGDGNGGPRRADVLGLFERGV